MLSRQFRTFNLEAFSLKTSDNGGFLEHTCSLSQNPILLLGIRNYCVSSVRCENEQARIDICVCCSVSLEKSSNYRTDFPTIDTREEDCCGAHFPPVAQMLLLSESDLQAWRKDYFSASFLPY
jgi:hypothetical protein